MDKLNNQPGLGSGADEGRPLEVVWERLLDGDPGAAVAFFDSLMDSDFAFAAGGFLRDLAERIVDVSDSISDQEACRRFYRAAREAILTCENGDEASLESLLQEAREP